MKKIIPFIIGVLIFFGGISTTNALSKYAGEILDIISKDRKLNIKDIKVAPLKYLYGDKYDGTYYDGNYSYVVESYLYTIPKVQEYFLKHPNNKFKFYVWCKTATNCGIIVHDDKYDLYEEEKEEFEKWVSKCSSVQNDCYPGYGYEKFDISLAIEDEKNINKEAYNYIKKFGKKEEGTDLLYFDLYLYDMGYINYIYNYPNSSLLNDFGYNYQKTIKFFPGIKNIYETFREFKYLYAGDHARGCGENNIIGGCSQSYVVYYKNVAYNVQSITFNNAPILLISDKTSDNKIIEEAENKISKYVGNTKISINIKMINNGTSEINNQLTGFLNGALETKNFNYKSNKYQLKLGNITTDLYIVKVPDKYVNMFKTTSNSINTGVKLTTTGVDVPFDSSLEVTNVTSTYNSDNTINSAYDINLYSLYKDGYITESANGFNVMIPVDDDFDANKKTIFYIDSEGNKKEQYDFNIETIDDQKYVTFTTKHLSVYALADVVDPVNDKTDITDKTDENDKTDQTIENPKTGYLIPTISIGIVGIIAVGILIISKKKNKFIKL